MAKNYNMSWAKFLKTYMNTDEKKFKKQSDEYAKTVVKQKWRQQQGAARLEKGDMLIALRCFPPAENIIPFAMEYVNGIMISARYPPIMPAASSAKSISFTADTIKSPTNIKAGAVANPGIARNTGERGNATMNISPVTTAVRPLRPPTATPALDST